jgi:cytoskeletal protein CcmA (bactofilin family)
MHIFGNLAGEGAIDISGRVDGDIKCLSVKLQPGSVVSGDIIVEKAEIHGEVKGNITAKTISCGSTAKIVGDIFHQRINIEDGAYIDGNCRKFIPEGTEIKRITSLRLIEDGKKYENVSEIKKAS